MGCADRPGSQPEERWHPDFYPQLPEPSMLPIVKDGASVIVHSDLSPRGAGGSTSVLPCSLPASLLPSWAVIFPVASSCSYVTPKLSSTESPKGNATRSPPLSQLDVYSERGAPGCAAPAHVGPERAADRPLELRPFCLAVSSNLRGPRRSCPGPGDGALGSLEALDSVSQHARSFRLLLCDPSPPGRPPAPHADHRVPALSLGEATQHGPPARSCRCPSPHVFIHFSFFFQNMPPPGSPSVVLLLFLEHGSAQRPPVSPCSETASQDRKPHF